MWRFVHLTDPHLASHRDGQWNNRFLCTMMPDVMGCLRKDLAAVAPDFILVTGDICSHRTREGMFEARDLMDSLGFPYYPSGGNHDFVLAESRGWFREAFHDHLPTHQTVYSFTHKNLHFCVLDPWWQWDDGTLSPVSEAAVAAELDMSLKNARWALPPNQFAWLQKDLETHDALATIVAMHYPAVPIPDRLRRPDLKDGGRIENGDLLLQLLARFPQVKAIFSGHVHLHFVECVGSITQVVTAALPEYPTEYRTVEVYEDRLEVSACPLSDPQYAARSLIPGNEFTSGQAQDRALSIPLT